ncbi:MAG: acyl-CoA dehydrogenase [Thiomonas sp. 14-64-326]|nr:MAG: acyl-CoA dehydrogenase [Thiomonas sp. 14-64-326]
MEFNHSEKVRALQERVSAFMDAHIYPNEARFAAEVEANRKAGNAWQPTRVIEELKAEARKAGLWNLFLPESERGAGLSNLEYAPLCEIMGRSHIAPEAFNCSAPDTGNMEVLERYGTPQQKMQWLEPLLRGDIRSVLIFMGKTDADNPDRYRQQSMILVPMDTPGVQVLRHLPVFGYDDAPHGHAEITFTDVRVPAANMLLGEGRGFEIAQGRLGPGRIHHCMRLIGLAERALESMCQRAVTRTAFGRPVADQGVTRERIANARILIDQARLLVFNAADKMDRQGNKAARKDIAMIKVVAPNMACQVIDWAMQVHGGGGVSDDFGLAYAYANARTLRFADGPDEVHRDQIARLELERYRPKRELPTR